MKHTKEESTQYYKSMRLLSTNLVVEVQEKSNISPGDVRIYHSPRKWDDDQFMVHLKDRQGLRDYIAMLQDFDETYGHLLDQIQAPTKPEGKI